MSPPLPQTARLIIDRGFSRATLRAKAGLETLYQAPTEGRKKPTIEESGATVRLRFVHDWPWQKSSAGLTLNADVTWDVEIRGGIAGSRAELDTLKLSSFEIGGGVSNLDLAFGRPVGNCVVRVSGGASHLVFRRPKDVGVRLAIRGGASQVALDDFFFGAVGGKLRMETPHYADAKDRYDIEITGGVSHLKIGSL